MGDRESMDELLARLRRTGAEPDDLEVTATVGGLPHTVPETLSASANGSGGTLVLGVSEADGFTLVPGFEPQAIRDAMADACANKVLPPLRVPIEIVARGVAVRAGGKRYARYRLVRVARSDQPELPDCVRAQRRSPVLARASRPT